MLIVLLDDVGAEQLAPWRGPSDPEAPVAETPTIDCLCERGVRFTRAWNEPVCSPGRAVLLTGRFDQRTGVGSNVRAHDELGDDEATLAEVFGGAGYTTGFAGKWHLGGWRSPDGRRDPLSQGFGWFAGTPTNLLSVANPPPPADGVEGFFGFWHVDDEGERAWEEDYATTVDIDDAVRFVRRAEPPWLLVTALHAPHPPLHVPPEGLVHAAVDERSSRPELYRAALEAVDTELARLLHALPRDAVANTVVVLTADNGTPPEGLDPVAGVRAKGTLYEQGVRVPLLFVGPGIRGDGRETPALAHAADVLPTLADLAGVPIERELDGVSQAPVLRGEAEAVRSTVVTRWTPLAGAPEGAARDDRYKLVVGGGRDPELYDLRADPGETRELLSGAPTASELEAEERLLTALVDVAVRP